MASFLALEVLSLACLNRHYQWDIADARVGRKRQGRLASPGRGPSARICLMRNLLRRCASVLASVTLVACGHDDPGPLAGTWAHDSTGLRTTFRNGEMETLGMIEKASYVVDGYTVTVTSESGPMKGVASRFTMTRDGKAARSSVDVIRKVETP